VSTFEPTLRGRLARDAELLWTSARYELAKATAFRVGFLVRELLRGLGRPIAVAFLLLAVYDARGGAPIGELSRRAALEYLVLLALVEKVVAHERLLDLHEQIFAGYVTKYLVMPFRFFALPLARFAQYTATQIVVVVLVWIVGRLALPDLWPRPASGVALAQSIVLALLGSYGLFLAYFVIACLAFWLDVVWTLFVMTRFLVLFAAGAVIPAAMMPAPVVEALRWTLPYWTIAGPIEIYAGRADTADFLRGLLVLGASVVVLEILRRVAWKRGLRRYGGSGM
jgi:ABC-2 type transport system permease protein